MSLKRRPEDGKHKSDTSTPDDKRPRPPPFANVVREMMKIQSVKHLLEPILEPLIRRVVKEEVELALRKHLTSLKQTGGKEMHTSELRSMQLQFENNISLPVFTGARIEGEDGSNLRVVLVDVSTGKVVSSGPESLAKVEIVVLEGDFEDESEIWMPEEFKSNIVREREGKKPLLTGDVAVYLKDGTVYKKHHPPNLFDEVWRLEKIGKDGAFHKRLSREKIYSVKDFLTLLNLDPAKLRSILGTGMSAKMWEITVEHARTCTIDTTRHVYFPPPSQQKAGVVFNAVGQVTGLLSECEYVPVHKLSETEKADAQELVISAIKQGEKFSSYEDEASLLEGSSHLTNVLYSSNSPNTEGSSANKLLAPQKTEGPTYTPASASSPDIMSSIYSVGGTSALDDFCMPNFDSMSFGFPVQVANTLICDPDPMAHAFGDEDHLRFFDTDQDLQSAVDSFMLTRSSIAIGKAQRRWRKVTNVLKWFMVRKRKSERY
ncbi:hypothetical protein PIB30_046177 [Stylosanthes scabra]|uniref:Calmodulin-binding protein 60 A n=1 Tax=Stylosanthes scabra TaxID=79078 RepID=A0ABU6WEG6_9FABA|nr:hypothetical protein [Stylosanthes scabra]